jgi:hypothetical protein
MTLRKVQDSHVAIVECCECGDDIQRSEYRSVLTCGHRHAGCRPVSDITGGLGGPGGTGVIGSGGPGGNGADGEIIIDDWIERKESGIKVALNKLFNWVVK